LNVNREASMDWVRSNKTEFTSQTRAAVGARIVSHMMEKGADKIRPEIVAMIQGAAPPAKE
jgi:limonene 1,2-monooxygenase